MNLQERAVLVSLNVRMPTITRRDRKATEDVERLHNSRNLGRFNKDLVRKDFFAPIQAAVTAARGYMYSMTVPWGNDYWLLAVRRKMEFAEKMLAHIGAIEAQADALAAKWPEVVEEARTRLGDLFEADQYPSPTAVRERFKVRLKYLPVPSGNDLRVSLDDEQLTEMRLRIEEDTREALNEASRVPWERLHEAVERMATSLAKPEGRVYDTVVSNLAGLCDTLPDLNFVEDERLTKAITLVKQQLILPVERLREDKGMKANTAAAAAKIAGAMAGWMNR